MDKRSRGDDYLAQYPRFLKWMNQCVACGRKGHKPEMPPNDHPNFWGQTLRAYFEPLAVNDVSLCEQCAAHRKGRR